MECSKWKEYGLLYLSGELTESTESEYRHHLQGCTECRREHDAYMEARRSLFSHDLLGEQTTPRVDATIKRTCCGLRIVPVGWRLFPMFVRKGVFSLGFLALGIFVGSVTIFYAAKTGEESSQASIADQVGSNNRPDSTTLAVLDDSLSDSLASSGNTPRPFSDSATPTQGIVPVGINR